MLSLDAGKVFEGIYRLVSLRIYACFVPAEDRRGCYVLNGVSSYLDPDEENEHAINVDSNADMIRLFESQAHQHLWS